MTTENGTDGAQLADEIRLLVDLVVERAKPWLDSVLEAGHGHGHTDTGPRRTLRPVPPAPVPKGPSGARCAPWWRCSEANVWTSRRGSWNT